MAKVARDKAATAVSCIVGKRLCVGGKKVRTRELASGKETNDEKDNRLERENSSCLVSRGFNAQPTRIHK